MTREARVLALTDALARGLLHAYPAPFRHRVGNDLRLCLRDACRAAWRRGGWTRVLLFGTRAAADLVTAAVAERWSQLVRRTLAPPEPAAAWALLGGVSWLALVGNTALRQLPAGANAVLEALASAGCALALLHAARRGRGPAADGERIGLTLALLGAIPPVVIGAMRLAGRSLGGLDFMDGLFVMLLGWIVLGAASFNRAGVLPRPAGAALLVSGVAGLWVGVGDRHGFGALAMLLPLSLIGVLWISIAAWVSPPRPEPADRGIISS